MNALTPRVLLIETSGATGIVGIAHGAELLAQSTLDPARRRVRDLAPCVKNLLQTAGWIPRNVSLVCVSRGPGSYTGLRVGMMSAKAFAYATKCDFIAVDTFAAIANRCLAATDVVEVIADALRGLVYAQRFGARAQRLRGPLNDLAILPKERWLEKLSPGAVVTGPGVELVTDMLPAGMAVAPVEVRTPDLNAFLRVALGRHGRGERDDPWLCEPLYLRPSSAEENWARIQNTAGQSARPNR